LPFNMYFKCFVSLKREQVSFKFLLGRTPLNFKQTATTNKAFRNMGSSTVSVLIELHGFTEQLKKSKTVRPRQPKSEHKHSIQTQGWLCESKLYKLCWHKLILLHISLTSVYIVRLWCA